MAPIIGNLSNFDQKEKQIVEFTYTHENGIKDLKTENWNQEFIVSVNPTLPLLHVILTNLAVIPLLGFY